MFGFGSNRGRRVRNETFSSNRLRNAALAGIGMLAWRWWRNRQNPSQPTTYQDRSFSPSSTRTGDAL